MKFTTTLFAVLACAVSSVIATPLEPRATFATPGAYPKAGTVWTVGQRHNVTWSTTAVPANSTATGFIYLGKSGSILPSGPGSLSAPLASGFPLTLGRFEITVPSVPSSKFYQLAVTGGGNPVAAEALGESFQIINNAAAAVATATTTGAPTTTV